MSSCNSFSNDSSISYNSSTDQYITRKIEYITLGATPTIVNAFTNFIYADLILNCSNPDGCQYNCESFGGCQGTTINCHNSSIGCDIRCYGEFASCNSLVVNALNLENSSEPLSTSVSIYCDHDNCENIEINIDGISNVYINCINGTSDGQSCQNLKATFSNMDFINNQQNASITCYEDNSCHSMEVTVNDTQSKVNINMLDYSEHVIINDPSGFIDDGRLKCGDLNYIQYDYGYGPPLENLLESKFTSDHLPCNNMVYNCINDQTSELQDSCTMSYEFIDKSIIEATQSNINDTCTNILIKDLVTIWCPGSCIKSPTKSPTLAPSNAPSLAPTSTPSRSPSATPSMAPSMAPVLPPSNAPSMSPTRPPTNQPIPSPTGTPTDIPTSAPTWTPTSAPTPSPSAAPTRLPTITTDNWDTKINIVYVFRGFTNDNYYDVWYWPETGLISKMEELIEENYFDGTRITSYSVFSVEILKINGVDYTLNDDSWNVQLLYEGEKMEVESRILFQSELSNYFLVTSKSDTFAQSVTNSFRRYINNSGITFNVQDASSLSAEGLTTESGLDENTIFWIITSLLFASVLIILLLSFCSAMYKKQLLLPVDNSNWISVILLLLCIWDVFTNINLAHYIFSTGSREDYNVRYLAGIFISAFAGLRILLNLCFALWINRRIYDNYTAIKWLEDNKLKFMILVVITGGNFYPVLYVVSSRLFGIEFTNSGVSLIELNGMYLKSNSTLLVILLIECLGPLIAEYVIFGEEGLTAPVLWAITSTLFFFIIYNVFVIVNQIERRREGGKGKIAAYYLQVKLDKRRTDIKELKKHDKSHINNRKGLKSQLKLQFLKVYPDQFLEIGNVTIQKNAFVIRIIHLINRQTKISKNHTEKLFSQHESQINDVIFAHFPDLDRNIFEIKFYKKFPSLARMTSTREMIKRQQKLGSGRRLSFTMDDNALKRDGTLLQYGHEDDDRKYDSSSDDDSDDSDGQETGKLNHHRSQFRKAMQIIGDEREKGRTDYNRLVFLLQENNIEYGIIDDVLKFGAKAGLFSDKEDDDIDNSQDSDQGGYTSSVGGKIEMMRLEYANANRNDYED